MGVLKAQVGVSDVESAKLVSRSGLHLKQQATLHTNNGKYNVMLIYSVVMSRDYSFYCI